ncbi:hypothetical protein [Nodosilinea nodulosa]|uniref:hypothetical protein n=1 Tax=Nodosilinea nodulosa TaxID=416001 RepID=UPI0003044730|nr:hypothetical protein [Nodosilinea nodulosa]
MPVRSWRVHNFKARHYAERSKGLFTSQEALDAREDLDKFIEYVSGHKVAHCHMKRWSEAWATGRDNVLLKKIAGPNESILAPRGSAKSTRVAYFLAWTIGHNPAIPIIYLSYKSDIACSRSRVIQRIIESPKYQEVFPWIRPNKKRWNQSEWEIDKAFAGVSNLEQDYTLYAVGIDGGIVSKRSWLIVVDDPIKNRESIENPDIREKISNNWRDAAKPTLVPGGRMLSIGTRFRPDDIHATDFNKENGWNIIEQQAIITDEDGQESSYWEERFPYRSQIVNEFGDEIEGLYEMREKDPVSFSFQYQNVVVHLSNIAINPDWIVYTSVIPKDPFKYGLGLDLSGAARERNDFTAMVLGSLERTMEERRRKVRDRLTILEAVRGRWPGNLDKIDKILELCVEWGIIFETDSEEYPYQPNENKGLTVFAEAVQYQVSFQYDWKRIIEGKYKLWNLSCKGVKVKGDKDLRLKSVTGVFQDGLIKFNEYRDMSRLVTELTNHGATDNDDLEDAFVHLVRGMVKYRPITTGEQEE